MGCARTKGEGCEHQWGGNKGGRQTKIVAEKYVPLKATGLHGLVAHTSYRNGGTGQLLWYRGFLLTLLHNVVFTAESIRLPPAKPPTPTFSLHIWPSQQLSVSNLKFCLSHKSQVNGTTKTTERQNNCIFF